MRKPRMQCLEENNGTLQNPFVRFSYNDSDGSWTSWTSWTPKRTFDYQGTTREGMWRPECKDCVGKDGSDGSWFAHHWCKNAVRKKSQTPSENNLLGWRRIFVPWLPWWQFNRMTGYTSQVPCHVLLGLWLCSVNVLRFRLVTKKKYLYYTFIQNQRACDSPSPTSSLMSCMYFQSLWVACLKWSVLARNHLKHENLPT